ncbi:MAG: hypothetical protein AAGU78_10260 [Chloroflexota bacterium]|nr:hypothetical protein [Anaerolineae bacterium]HMM27539.1 hypothetical protein [Aggregatilineaceae bacterium]
MKKVAFLFVAVFVTAALVIPSAKTFVAAQEGSEAVWTQDYITSVPPIFLRDPLLEMFGQTADPIPYTYEEAVKLSGHSCGAVAGAWTITRKALAALYPDEVPVRGQIVIHAPGAEDEWHVGVFGEVMTYLTGAAPHTGFSGAEFGQADQVFIRRNKLIYAEAATGTPPPQMQWVFERLDTGKKVGVSFNVMAVQPLVTEDWTKLGVKLASGAGTPEEIEKYVKWWNDRALFVLDNADTMDGLFVVKELE